MLLSIKLNILLILLIIINIVRTECYMKHCPNVDDDPKADKQKRYNSVKKMMKAQNKKAMKDGLVSIACLIEIGVCCANGELKCGNTIGKCSGTFDKTDIKKQCEFNLRTESSFTLKFWEKPPITRRIQVITKDKYTQKECNNMFDKILSFINENYVNSTDQLKCDTTDNKGTNYVANVQVQNTCKNFGICNICDDYYKEFSKIKGIKFNDIQCCESSCNNKKLSIDN